MLYKFTPYFLTIISALGLLIFIISSRKHLTTSQIKRLQRLYLNAEQEDSNNHLSLHEKYKVWVQKNLNLIGYNDSAKKFSSLVRVTGIFFFVSGFLFFFLSGYNLANSFIDAWIIFILSLVIPHLILIYLVKYHIGILALELATITGYIFDAVQAAGKPLYTAINESLSLIVYLVPALERFLSRYLTSSIYQAGKDFIKEVPIPEAEQFIFLITNSLNYNDEDTILDYLNITNNTRHNLLIQMRERREKSREVLFDFQLFIPVGLTLGIIIFTLYSHITSVMTQTYF